MTTRDILKLAIRLAPYVMPQLKALQAPQQATQEKLRLHMELKKLKTLQGGVILVVGARGTGKTKLAHRIAQFMGRPAFAVSPGTRLPKWIQRVGFNEIESVPGGAVLILDDIPLYASSRDYNEADVKRLERIVPIARHWQENAPGPTGLMLVFVTHASSFTDKYLLQADAVFLKPLSLLFEDYERSILRKHALKAMEHFKTMAETDWKKHAYFITHTYEGMVKVSLPRLV